MNLKNFLENQILDRIVYVHSKHIFDYLYSLLPAPKSAISKLKDATFIGHRGVFNHPSVRENTFAAFDLAIKHKAGLEFDLRLSKDQVPVVYHDPILLRVHGVKKSISQLTIAEIKSMAPDIPTFSEFLDRYQKVAPVLYTEAKVIDKPSDLVALAKQVREIVLSRGLLEKCHFCTRSTDIMDVFREYFPEITKSLIFMVKPGKYADYVANAGDIGLMGWYYTYPKKLLAKFIDKGDPVALGFFNHTNTVLRFLSLGVQRFFSDRIDLLQPRLEGLILKTTF